MTTLFSKDVDASDDNQNGEIQSYLEVLVGPDKKFKDPESLAKGKYESDKFIERLLYEQEEMRKDLDARLKLEELVSKLGSERGATNQPTQTVDEGRNNENSNKDVDINSLIDAAFNKKQTELARQANLRETETELKKVWGSDYANKLRKAVNELGVSPEFIDDVAAKSSKAAVALLLGTTKEVPKQTTDVSPPRSSMNTFGSVSPTTDGTRLKEFYSKMRRENPKQYWSAKTQMEIHELALAGKISLD